MQYRSFCRLAVITMSLLVLVSCKPKEERQADALKLWGQVTETATGTVTEAGSHIESVLEVGKVLIDSVKGGVDEVKQRVDAVTEGVEKIQEGKALIEEGLGVDEEEGTPEGSN